MPHLWRKKELRLGSYDTTTLAPRAIRLEPCVTTGISRKSLVTDRNLLRNWEPRLNVPHSAQRLGSQWLAAALREASAAQCSECKIVLSVSNLWRHEHSKRTRCHA
mmetsp:Transcript_36593/g.97573  ORF Transcript_36593/g.97573 Transcript_36593/m.97573 type:complete len:106 (-) Transcript_36593:906-1223(-)